MEKAEKFVHLHMHTEYSLLDGANRIDQLPQRIKELGMNACAVTDHGSMYGAVEFYEACLKHAVKPIIGAEVYVAPNGRFSKDRPEDKRSYHLLLLAENNEGLKNLNRLVSLAHIEGFYYRPRVDIELLEQYSEGLICTSACLSGELARKLLQGDYEAAKASALRYERIFGKGNFFIELQSNGIAEQLIVNADLIRIAHETGIGLVATNDCHYTYKEDAKAHEILLCMQTGKRLSDPDRMRLGTDAFYVKSPEEMIEAFKDVPEAIENTLLIADRCHAEFDFDTIHLPEYDVPATETAKSYLRRISEEGLERRLAIHQAKERHEYQERLDYELSVIDRMGYNDYYLIVWDFIDFAKRREIMVGPGRGSGAASLVAYALGITNLDPLEYALLFERFLNPERVSMPDFDIDFCYERRSEVIDYVYKKYGNEHTAQVITFGTLAAKQAVRDVARALDLSYADTDRIAKLIPFALGMTLDKALEISPEFKQAYDTEDLVHEVIDYAMKFEGMPRHASTHAAGVVISKEALTDIAPLARNDENIVVQYSKNVIEKIGLLKFDFLGLRTLTVLRDTRDMVMEETGHYIDFDTVKMDDPAVYKMIARGETEGVFQLESAGMTSFMKELKPESLEDIIAGVALYRPGPMDQIPRYVAARHDADKVSYHHPLLEPILNVTYGTIVYQEQVMQIVRDLAGFTMGQSDNVRRAMSKKKPDELARYRSLFIHGGQSDSGQIIDGAVLRGVPESVASTIWDEVMAFAGYAFNKAHAACYAVVAYYTAWLKLHYPVPFMAAMLNSFLGQLGQAAHYVRVCRDMNIGILPPDINRSQVRFTSEGGQIRFALGAVKNVGTAVLEKLIVDREAKGPFKTFGDFLRRAQQLGMNRKMIESLIKSSALDAFEIPRNQLIAATDPYLNMLASRKDVMEGQLSFFDFGMPKEEPVEPTYPTLPALDKSALLTMELEMLGLYISGHPLDAYKTSLKAMLDTRSSDLNGTVMADENLMDELETAETRLKLNGKYAKMAGLVVKSRNLTTKKGEMMCFLELEDMEGRFEVIVFPKTFSVYRNLIQEGAVLLASGRINAREDEEAKLLADKLEYMPNDEEFEAREADFFPRGQSKRERTSVEEPRSLTQRDEEAIVDHYEAPFEGEGNRQINHEAIRTSDEPHMDDMPINPLQARAVTHTREATLKMTDEDQALIASGMHIVLSLGFNAKTDAQRWMNLMRLIDTARGRVALRIVADPSTGVILDGIEELAVSLADGFLERIADLCGADAISFAM